MPESKRVQFRNEKKVFRGFESLKARGKYSKAIQQKLLNWVIFIKEIDKRLYSHA